MTDYDHWCIIPGQLKEGELCRYATRSMDDAEADFLKHYPDGITANGLNVRIMPLTVEYPDGREGIRYGHVTS
jgi:hypothetical protein